MTFTILGCGSSGGVPRVGAGWGACDPNNPKNRRRRCSLLVERRGDARRHPRADRHLARPARAVARRRRQSARRRAVHARACRPYPWHRRPARCWSIHQPAAGSTSIWTSRRPRSCTRASAIASRRRPAATYPPILNEHRLAARAAGDDRRAQGGPIEALPLLQDHGDIPSLGFRFGGVAYSADIKACPTRAWRRWPGSTSGSWTRCATRRIRAISARRRPWPGSSACKPATGDPDQHACRPGLRGAARATAGGRGAGLRRHADHIAELRQALSHDIQTTGVSGLMTLSQNTAAKWHSAPSNDAHEYSIISLMRIRRSADPGR